MARCGNCCYRSRLRLVRLCESACEVEVGFTPSLSDTCSHGASLFWFLAVRGGRISRCCCLVQTVGEFEGFGVVVGVMVGSMYFTIGFDVGGILGVDFAVDENGRVMIVALVLQGAPVCDDGCFYFRFLLNMTIHIAPDFVIVTE